MLIVKKILKKLVLLNGMLKNCGPEVYAVGNTWIAI